MADDTKLRSLRANGPGALPGRADRDSSADPLAELARLIGQDNVFDQMRRDAASVGTRGGAATRAAVEPSFAAPSRVAPAPDHELRGSYDAFAGVATEEPYVPIAPAAAPMLRERVGYSHEPEAHGYSAHYSDAQGHAYHDDAAGAYGDPYYDDGVPEAHGAADPYGAEDPDALEDARPKRRRVGVAAVAAVVGLAAIGTAGAFGYRALTGGGSSGGVPIIKADSSPAKVVPPAGGEKENGKLLYDRVDKGQSEKVVPREEQPVDMREARGAAPKPAVPQVGGGVPAAGSSPLTTGSTPTVNPNEPKKVRTFAIRPDGTAGTDSAAKVPANAGTRMANLAPTAPKPVTTRSIPVAPDAGVAARPATDAPARTASIPATAPASPSVNAPAAPAGGHVVQLSSQKSESEAQASFRSLQAKYPSVLSGRQPIIRRVELGEKGTYYRAQVGPFASAEQANELCSSLKAAGGQCVVQRN